MTSEAPLIPLKTDQSVSDGLAAGHSILNSGSCAGENGFDEKVPCGGCSMEDRGCPEFWVEYW